MVKARQRIFLWFLRTTLRAHQYQRIAARGNAAQRQHDAARIKPRWRARTARATRPPPSILYHIGPILSSARAKVVSTHTADIAWRHFRACRERARIVCGLRGARFSARAPQRCRAGGSAVLLPYYAAAPASAAPKTTRDSFSAAYRAASPRTRAVLVRRRRHFGAYYSRVATQPHLAAPPFARADAPRRSWRHASPGCGAWRAPGAAALCCHNNATRMARLLAACVRCALPAGWRALLLLLAAAVVAPARGAHRAARLSGAFPYALRFAALAAVPRCGVALSNTACILRTHAARTAAGGAAGAVA